MTAVWPVLAWGLASLVLLPISVLVLESLAALWPRRSAQPPATSARLAALVPAHDEAELLPACLRSVGPQLRSGDRLVVVAHNCADDTAALAERLGAEVVTLRDAEARGKGHALAAGVRHLEADPPDLVVVVDADARCAPGCLEALRRAVAATGRSAQAVNLLAEPAPDDPQAALTWLGVCWRNLVRPLGLHRLGLPCLLTGSGMAIPWQALRSMPLATDRTAQDIRLAVDLALAGCETAFCPAARLESDGLERDGERRDQKRRWIHGHLQALLTRGPALLAGALRQRRPRLLAPALDLSVPPLSLLLLGLLAAIGLAAAAGRLAGAWSPFRLLLWAALLWGLAGLAVWSRFARRAFPPRALAALPRYVARQTSVFRSFSPRRAPLWFEEPAPSAKGSPRAEEDLHQVALGATTVAAVDEAQCVAFAVERWRSGAGAWIVPINLDHLRRFGSDRAYAALAAGADLRIADGMPLVWASRLQRDPLPARVAGSDLIWSLAGAAAREGRSAFLVGGDPGTADVAGERLAARHPGLRVRGAAPAPRGFERSPRQIAEIEAALRRSRADLVLVALPAPLQEQTVARLRPALPAAVWLGVGVSFSFVAGRVRRAPVWMRRSGLEWLHRLAQEPARLAPRYLRCLPVALALLARSAVAGLRRRRPGGSYPRG